MGQLAERLKLAVGASTVHCPAIRIPSPTPPYLPDTMLHRVHLFEVQSAPSRVPDPGAMIPQDETPCPACPMGRRQEQSPGRLRFVCSVCRHEGKILLLSLHF